MNQTDYVEQLDALKSNEVVSLFFAKNTNLTVKDFLLKYIQVHEFISSNEHEQPSVINSMINNLDTTFNNKLDALKNQIDSLSNSNVKTELLQLFHDNFNTFSTHLHSHQQTFSKDFDNIKLYINNTLQTVSSDNDKRAFEHMSQLISSLSVNDKINSIHEILTALHTNLTSHSTNKGAISENILCHKLTAEFPDADIIETRNIPRSGDFIINRANKPKVMIDIKNYQRNVPTIEIDKFFRDIQEQKCSAILASVQSGIACKQNFEIELIDNRFIAVFIHNFNFDPFFIRLATNVIDHLSVVLQSHYNLDNVVITRDSFASLKSEYETFLSVFNNHISIIQSNLTALSSIQMSLLDQFFSSKTSHVNPNANCNSGNGGGNARISSFFCSVCKKYYKNKFTLERHFSEKHPELAPTPPPPPSPTTPPTTPTPTHQHAT
jgi:hypothetical protein